MVCYGMVYMGIRHRATANLYDVKTTRFYGDGMNSAPHIDWPQKAGGIDPNIEREGVKK